MERGGAAISFSIEIAISSKHSSKCCGNNYPGSDAIISAL
jgi:hypothetical protein